MISYSPSEGCIRSTLIVRTLWHHIFSRCYSASLVKPMPKNVFVWILSGDTVYRLEPLTWHYTREATNRLTTPASLILCHSNSCIHFAPLHDRWHSRSLCHVLPRSAQVGTCALAFDTLWAMLPFSELKNIPFGYFDPEKIFLGNKSKFFQGELDDSWEFDDSAAATATSSRAASSFITQSNAAFFAASSADLQSCRVALRAAWPQVVSPDNPSSPATSHAAANFFPETSAGAWSCTTLPDDRSSRVPSHAAEPCSD